MISDIKPLFDLVILDNNYMFLDFWSIFHFISGMLIFALLLNFFTNIRIYANFGILFELLLFWEIIELITYKFMNGWFAFFGIVDLFWDMALGMFGGFLIYWLRRKI